MSATIKIELDTAKLDNLPAQVRKNAASILDAAAKHIEAGAKRLAPIDTGALKGNIGSRRDGPLTRVVYDGVEYGVHQEYGTSRFAAQPFMTPAVEAERGPLKSAWKGLIK